MSAKQAFIFPGQGSQTIGMGRDLAAECPAARAVFEEVNDALSQDLSGLMWDGDSDTLTLTENAQPALMAVSLAVVRSLESRGIRLDSTDSPVCFVAGHSLGEYSALAAAGTFSLTDVARLLKARGQAMQQAVPAGEGAMAALIGASPQDAAAIAAQAAQEAAQEAAQAAQDGSVCAVANDNAPGQVVISGHADAVRRAVAAATDKNAKWGVKRAIMLPVSAPFHCPLMAPAAKIMAAKLSDASMLPPRVPLVANVTARPVSAPDEIRSLLVKQVTATVYWRDSICYMVAQGVDEFVEIGAGSVLTGMVKRIDRGVRVGNLTTPQDVAGFMKDLENV